MASFNPFNFNYEDVDKTDFAEKGKQYMKEMSAYIENYSDGIVAAEYGASWEDVNQFLLVNKGIEATKLFHIAAFNIENRLYKHKRTTNKWNKTKTQHTHRTTFECTMCKESIIAVKRTEVISESVAEEDRAVIQVMSQHIRNMVITLLFRYRDRPRAFAGRCHYW